MNITTRASPAEFMIISHFNAAIGPLLKRLLESLSGRVAFGSRRDQIDRPSVIQRSAIGTRRQKSCFVTKPKTAYRT